MNLQDIADFIDLVKNTAKYERVLNNIKEEQDRLNAVIATVGKASELEKLRKEVEKERVDLVAQFEKDTAERDAYVTKEVALLADKKRVLDEALGNVAKATSEASDRIATANNLMTSVTEREQALKKGEATLTQRQKQLDALISEYNEKITKLRSVMG